jgi:hypothetical protein
MEKKESADKLFSDIKPPSKNKLKEIAFTLLKLTAGICLLTFVYGVSVSFSDELVKLAPAVVRSFVWGMAGFLGIYLFIYEPAVLFKKGQRILEVIFRFFAPLVRVAPYALPAYTFLICFVYLIWSSFVDIDNYLSVFLFSIGFSAALHLVFCAKTLRSKQGDSLKSNYIFGFSCIYILNALSLAGFFSLAFEDFSFVNFFNSSYQIAKGILGRVFSQLFL